MLIIFKKIYKKTKVFKEYTIEVKMIKNQFNTKWTKFILQNRTFHNFLFDKTENFEMQL